MISRATICLYRLRHTAVVAAAPAMISRAKIFLYRLRHTAVAATAPVTISRGTIYLYRLRHTAVAAAAPPMISRVLRRSTVVVIAIVRNRSCDATAAATVQHCRRSSKQLRHIAVAAVAPPMISRVLRSNTVVVIAIVRNRSCDATAAATVQHCHRSSKQLRHIAVAAVAPAMISRVLRSSRVVVIVIVRNRSCDTTVAAMVQHCRRSSSQAPALSLALSGTRGTTAAKVQRRHSSQPHSPSLTMSGTRGTTAATVQRRRRQPPAPSLALAGTRGTTAATVQRRSSSHAPAPPLALAGTRGTLATVDRR